MGKKGPKKATGGGSKSRAKAVANADIDAPVPSRPGAFSNFTGMSMTDLLALTMTTSSKPSSRNTLQHYTKHHRILLIGEGDFTFARALGAALGSSANIVATSFDSLRVATEKYSHLPHTLKELADARARVLHNVDATRLSSNKALKKEIEDRGAFHRIVFQFPHIGGSSDDDVQANKDLLDSFFAETVELLAPEGGGEIHVTLRDTPFYRKWDVEALAAAQGLEMLSRDPFDAKKFAGLGYTPQRTNPAVREAPSMENAFVHVFSPGVGADGAESEDEVDDAPKESGKRSAKAVDVPSRNGSQKRKSRESGGLPRKAGNEKKPKASAPPPHPSPAGGIQKRVARASPKDRTMTRKTKSVERIVMSAPAAPSSGGFSRPKSSRSKTATEDASPKRTPTKTHKGGNHKKERGGKQLGVSRGGVDKVRGGGGGTGSHGKQQRGSGAFRGRRGGKR